MARRLEEAGAAAVTVAPADGAEDLLEAAPGTAPVWRETVVEGLFAAAADVEDIAARCGRRPVAVRPLGDEDWSATWRREPVRRRFGRLLVLGRDEIRAYRHSAGGGDAAHAVIGLDPGLAFGSGSHPTTAMCLEWLAALPLAGARVLDVGCGCGILSVAAAALGAGRVSAVDHDPQALYATADNAAANGASERIATMAALAEASGEFDVVVANIVSGTLIEMAPAILSRLAPSGRICLSGLLADQVPAVRSAYAPGVRFGAPVLREDWVALNGLRRPGEPPPQPGSAA